MMRIKATIEVEIEGEDLDEIVLRAALFKGVSEMEKFKGVSEMEKAIKTGILGGGPIGVQAVRTKIHDAKEGTHRPAQLGWKSGAKSTKFASALPTLLSMTTGRHAWQAAGSTRLIKPEPTPSMQYFLFGAARGGVGALVRSTP